MTTSRQTKGYINGVLASVSYGTNPLFALPLYACGIGASSVLFFRYFIATLIYYFWLKFVKKISLKINKNEVITLFILGLTFSLSSITLFVSFKYIESGIACTILFVYPAMVAIIMAMFFKEKLSFAVLVAMFITALGIVFLSNAKTDSNINLLGLVLIFVSALSYAIYMVGVKKLPAVKHLRGDKLSFYVMLFGISVYVVSTKFCTNLQILSTPKEWLLAICIAIIPTIISLETITIAIKFIGSTKTAILGALEPLTATVLGILLFGESISISKVIGMLLVFAGVFVIINSKK